MTPEQKAKQIYDEAYKMIYTDSHVLNHKLAINIGRFTVNEMLNHFEQIPEVNTAKYHNIRYFDEVLYHLENL